MSFNATLQSAWSNVAVVQPPVDSSVTPPGQLTDLGIGDDNSDFPTLQWTVPGTAPITDVDGVEVQEAPAGTSRRTRSSPLTFRRSTSPPRPPVTSPNRRRAGRLLTAADTVWYARADNAGGFGPWASTSACAAGYETAVPADQPGGHSGFPQRGRRLRSPPAACREAAGRKWTFTRTPTA